MVNYMLKITAEVENVKSLQPMGGCDDPNFTFYFKLRCENCGEMTPKETAVSLEEEVPLPKSRGHAHLLQKCKFCGREGNITMTPGSGRPLTDEHCEEGKYAPMMAFDCRGLEPVEFAFMGPQWRVESVEGTVYENVDLSEGEWFEYDEKGSCPVSISKLKSVFEVIKT